MKTRRFDLLIGRVVALMLCVLIAAPVPFGLARTLDGRTSDGSVASVQTQTGITGVSQTVQGVTVTLADLRSRALQVPSTGPRQASPRRTFDGLPAPAPILPTWPGSPNSQALNGAGPSLPQALGDEIIGQTITVTAGYVPPDSMGAAGSIDFLFSVNGSFQAYTKALPHTRVFSTTQDAFWGFTPLTTPGFSDAHVRYDRDTQRWFITEIDVPVSDNHIYLAVSSGSDLSTATWTQYTLPATGLIAANDLGCFADYDTPGMDQNAIYIGANMFGGGPAPCTGSTYKHSNLYVVLKAPTLSGSATTLTTFYNVVTGTSGIETIQGVDSFDALSTGYAISVKETENPRAHLNVWQIHNSGTTSPTVSGPTLVPISPELGALGGVLTANNAASGNPTRPMDDLDDRLYAAVIRSGHLWTSHNIAVDSTGSSNSGTRNREGQRWYDITVAGLTLNQSGTVFDSAGSNPLSYWMGTIMPSGQGHVAMGLNRANSLTAVQAGALGRLSGDTGGTMGAFTMYQNSVNPVGGAAWAYSDASFNPGTVNRWGDYSYTSLDPCDDMSLWTVQEYVAGPIAFSVPIDWGVAAEKLLAPPPATPVSSSSSIAEGVTGANVVITGTSSAGTGFYDTPSTITDPCRKRVSAAVSRGVIVNNVTYTDPTHVTLNISTVGVTPGPVDVTVTDPDGQNAVGIGILTIAPPITTTTTVASSLNPSVYGNSVTFTATVTSNSGTPAGTVTFLDGAATLGSNPLNVSGVATLSTSLLTAGTHTITAQYGGGGMFASSSGTLAGGQVVTKAPATVTLTGLAQTYDGTPRPIGATTVPASLLVIFSYNGSPTPPTNAGSYPVTGVISETNYTGSSGGTLVVSKAAATVLLTGLAQTYDGTPRPIGATTTPGGLLVVFSYNGSPTPPTNAGSYPVTGVISETNYTGSSGGTLVVSKAAATVLLTGLAQTYDGTPRPIGATTTPGGLLVIFSYNGSPTPPTNAGSYPVTGVISETNYTGSSGGTLVVSQVSTNIGVVSSKNPSTYGDAVTFTATVTSTSGLTPVGSATFTLDGSPNVVTLNGSGKATLTTSALTAGTHTLSAAFDGSTNFAASSSSTLAGGQVVNKASAGVTLTGLAQTYNGTPRPIGATTVPASLLVIFSYNGSPTPPTNAGSYPVTGVISETNYTGSSGGTLVVSKAAATVLLTGLAQTYDGTPRPIGATTTPGGLLVVFSYNGSPTPPTNAGSYPVTGVISETNYTGSSGGTLVVSKAAATVLLTGLAQTYDGTPRPIGATTTPGGLLVIFSYNGSPTPPTNAGSYPVTGVISETNYTGSSGGTLVVSQVSTNIGVVSSKNPSTYGDAVTFTATVTSTSGLTPVGSATFTLDGSPNVVTLNGSGKATLTTSALTAGAHTLSAAFDGSTNFTASISSTLAGGQVVNKAPAGVTLTGLAQSYNGTPRPIGATTVPSGLTVAFSYNGSATAPTIAGSYAVTGTVSNPNYVGSASGTLVIGKAATNITLASSSNPSLIGHTITFTATVTSPSGVTPVGSVTFSVDGAPVVVALDVNGKAVLTTSTLLSGSHAISASYTQSTNFSASGPANLTQAVRVPIYLPLVTS